MSRRAMDIFGEAGVSADTGHGFRFIVCANAHDRSQPEPNTHFGGTGATAADHRDVRGHHAGESSGRAEHGDFEGGLLQARPDQGGAGRRTQARGCPHGARALLGRSARIRSHSPA